MKRRTTIVGHHVDVAVGATHQGGLDRTRCWETLIALNIVNPGSLCSGTGGSIVASYEPQRMCMHA